MVWLRFAILALGFIEGGWMTFDGTRALTVGDYVTPSSGRYAGQLGHWTRVVSAIGIPPRSTAMKLIFVGYGLGWLVMSVGFAFHARWACGAMLIGAAATLWYLPIGTIVGLMQLWGLLWLHRHNG